MSDAWLQSVLASAPVICGRRLLPFSLAHSLALRRLKSPLAVGGDADFSDLILALEICSRSFVELPELIASPAFVRTVARKSHRWFYRFDTALSSFNNYRANFTATPPRKQSKGSKIKAPVEFYLATMLMTEFHFSEAAAWNCAFGRACCYSATWAERQGDDTILTENGVEKMLLIEEHAAAIARGDTAAAAEFARLAQIAANKDKD
jgi:hypothetical protein